MEQVLGSIASEAKGVVTREEALAAGITRHQIAERLRKGLLLREYRGVYRVGHAAPSTEARYLAAVKACGPEAVLCGRAAAHLMGLVRGRAPRPEVRTPRESKLPGVEVRGRCRVDHRERWTFDGVPATTVPRTLVDLAAVLDEDTLARVCHEAEVRYRTTPEQVEAVLRRRPNAAGAAVLRAVMRGGTPVPLSRLERGFLRFLRAEGFPPPETNRPAGAHRVDCRWPEHRLTVELDSYRYHSSRHAWEQDRERERAARERGEEHRRFTWADVFEGQSYMRGELRKLLPACEPAPDERG